MEKFFARKRGALAVATALGAVLGVGSQQATAQETQRVTITGSAISRVAEEGALPVMVLTTEDIRRTGATSATELIQMLPSMQNFVPSTSSVNGGGGGVTTAALHSLPSKYTLVLIDGQRMAPLGLGTVQGGGTGANISSIPIDAVERVEILTDGASALYGSDAIAGVVNFILKKNQTDGNVFFNYLSPQKQGGAGWSFGASKGFGDLGKDGHNVLVSFSRDEQRKLDATQRSVSERGAYFPFSANGVNYIFNNRTSNTEPANLTFSAVPVGAPAGTAAKSYSINPYYARNGNCGSSAAGALLDPTGTGALGAIGVSCRFNYASTVEDIPASKRESALAKGAFKLNEDTTLWGTLALSSYSMVSRFAPAAQPMGVNATTRLPSIWNAYVQPFLTANNLTAERATMGYRSVSLGGRTDDYTTDMQHFSFGVDGNAKGWDYKVSLTLSRSTLTDTAAGGYSDFNLLSGAVAAGTYDPVMGTGAGSVASAILKSKFWETVSDLNTLHFGAQHDLFKMAGGTSILSLGADYSKSQYRTDYSDLFLSQSGFSTQPASANYPVGGGYGQVPFDASRNNWGVYGEWLLPVTKKLEVTAAARYDSYAKVHSNYVFSPTADPVTGLQNRIANADLGNTSTAATGKLSFRFLPVEQLLLRGSYGTGFKAPPLADVASALTFGGSTSNSYPCPFPGSPGCLPGSAQYDLLFGGNGLPGSAGLSPEKSKQWTLGFRLDPIKSLSFGLDFWDVKITKQVLSQGIAEQVGFANPTAYAGLFVNPYQDPAGFTTIAFSQLPFNGGEAEYQGIDWDASYRTKLAFGNFAARWTGTYMMKQKYNFGAGQPFNSNLGVYGPDQQVVFRTTMNLALSLQTGAFMNTLTAHYKSGYHDQSYPAGTSVFLANPDGSLGASTAFAGLTVPSFTTFDWQTRYDYTKTAQLTFGIKNLFDKSPPLSLQTGGGGNMVGYDGRYYDPTGRLFYLAGSMRF
jgi:iron complex outermembrane receptor protein